jgi:hypothetical protein
MRIEEAFFSTANTTQSLPLMPEKLMSVGRGIPSAVSALLTASRAYSI